VEFDLGRLNEWIDNALVDEGDRGENVGKSPVYRYGCRHYRRVLQVLRLYSRGIKSVDQILIMLFLDGHGVKPFEVREPIAREFGRARAKLIAMARSPRVEQDEVVPPKHKESLVRNLGNPDKRFVEAGAVLGSDELIAAVRVARSPDPDSRPRMNAKSGAENLMLAFFKFALGGILSRDPEYPAEIDQIIANATDADLTLACSLLNLYRAVLSWLESKSRSPEIAGLFDGLSVSFSQPEYVAFQFALLLRFLKICPLDSISVTQASQAIFGILNPTKSH